MRTFLFITKRLKTGRDLILFAAEYLLQVYTMQNRLNRRHFRLIQFTYNESQILATHGFSSHLELSSDPVGQTLSLDTLGDMAAHM